MMIMISVGTTTIRRPTTMLHIMITIRFELKSCVCVCVCVCVVTLVSDHK